MSKPPNNFEAEAMTLMNDKRNLAELRQLFDRRIVRECLHPECKTLAFGLWCGKHAAAEFTPNQPMKGKNHGRPEDL